MQRFGRVPGGLAVSGIAVREHFGSTVDRATVDRSADEQRRAGRAERDRDVRRAGYGGAAQRGDRAERVGRRGIIADVFGKIVQSGDVIDRADRTDRLQFLAELALAQIGVAVAAECAICPGAGSGQVDHRHAVRTARVIELLHIDPAPGGDRTQFKLRRRLPLESIRKAVSLVDADLLRHPDIGVAHQGGAIDHHARQQRTDGALRSGEGGARGYAGAARRDRQRRGIGAAAETAVGVVVEQLAVERRVLIAGHVIGKIVSNRVGRPPPHRRTSALAVVIAKPGLPGERVAGDRVLVRDDRVQLDRKARDFGQVEVRAAIVGPNAAEAAFEPPSQLAAGRLADHRQRAAFGVAAEQRALRALEHFDPLDVEQCGVEPVLAAQVNPVDIDAHALFARWLVGVERNDPADADRQRRLARFEGCHAQAGHAAIGQIEQALDLAFADHFSAHHRDRDRGALQVGFALGGGHDDFGQPLLAALPGVFGGGGAGVVLRGVCSVSGGVSGGGISRCIDGDGAVGYHHGGLGSAGGAEAHAAAENGGHRKQ